MPGRRAFLEALGGAALLALSGNKAFAREPLPASCDVIVVGSGGAGLSAAAAAAEAGASVLVLEQEGVLGGNTRISGGFFGAVDPRRQKRLGIEDSFEHFTAQIVESGGGKSDPKLAAVLARGASEMLDFLEANGMRFKDEIIEIYGAHWQRCHKPEMPNGEGYVRTLLSVALRHGARVVTGVRGTDLALDPAGRVAGVVVEGETRILRARRGVIVASGGFGASEAMIARFAPALSGLTTDNGPGSTGEMLLACGRAGADLIGMEEVQCLPGCPPGRAHRVRLHNDVSRFIFVNQEGRRFVREDERRDRLRDTILALPGKTAFTVADDDGLRSYDILMQKEAVRGVETGDAWCAETVGELASAMGLSPGELEKTVADYNAAVRAGRDPLGKSPAELRHEIAVPPFWGCFAAMTVHYTMGGLRIDERARVLDRKGRPIPGLWAAGESTGGIHGVNRMGANGINDALVFGRIAGLGAALGA